MRLHVCVAAACVHYVRVCVCVCVRASGRASSCVRERVHAHTRTSAAARVFFPSPLLHIIRENNILRIICMPYEALGAKSRKRARRAVRGSACPIGPPSSPFFVFFLLLSFFLSFFPHSFRFLLSSFLNYTHVRLRGTDTYASIVDKTTEKKKKKKRKLSADFQIHWPFRTCT